MTVIAIDPASGTSLYSSKPASFLYPGFTPLDASTMVSVADSTTPTTPMVTGVLASTQPGAVASSITPSAVRTVCGACGGVMPPPGTAIHFDSVAAIGGGGVVGVSPANAIFVAGRPIQQSVFGATDDTNISGIFREQFWDQPLYRAC